MNLLWDQVRNWFGFTRRERRATFILLVLITVVISLRYIVPDRSVEVEMIRTGSEPAVAEIITSPVTRPNIVSEGRSTPGVQKRPLIDINRCDSASLEALPGIGPVLSARIVRYRNLLGGYAKVSQLREVYGLSEETYMMIEKRLFADSLAVRKININNAEYKDLIRLPYFERSEVAGILKYRELKGRITVMSDLTGNNLIAPEKVARIRPYIEFGE